MNDNTTQNATSALAEEVGPVTSILYDIGVPSADFIGPPLMFLLVFVFLYGVSRLLGLPLLHRKLHVRRRLAIGVLMFFSTVIALQFAGYGLGGPASLVVAALFATGFAYRDRLAAIVLVDPDQREQGE